MPIVHFDFGFVASIHHGKLDLYDYELSSNIWVRTVTHLHEQSPAPVSGKTTRDITLTNARGEQIENRTEAYIDGIWYTIARNRMTYTPPEATPIKLSVCDGYDLGAFKSCLSKKAKKDNHTYSRKLCHEYIDEIIDACKKEQKK